MTLHLYGMVDLNYGVRMIVEHIVHKFEYVEVVRNSGENTNIFELIPKVQTNQIALNY